MTTTTAPPNPLASSPPAIKPTSRARIYRIPNTSDYVATAATTSGSSGGGGRSGHAQTLPLDGGGGVGGANVIDGNKKTGGNSNTSSESFLWATREMAALDFLMNVPLNAEKDIVRAGLSEGRWQHGHHRHASPSRHQPRNYSTTQTASQQEHHHEVYDEENKNWSMSQQPHPRSLSAFDITARCDIEVGRMSEATTTMTDTSSLHAMDSKLSTAGTTTVTAGGGGRWWDKLILKDKRFFSAANQQAQLREQLELEEKELERPTESPSMLMMSSNDGNVLNAQYNNTMAMMGASATTATAGGGVPGRRLDGIEAVTITIPTEFRRRPAPLRAAARQAAVREWEIKIAYGAQQGGTNQRLSQHQGMNHVENHTTTSSSSRQQALLDGRVFFSTKKSYPVAVFSTIKYEPKKEETLRRRKQLEKLGGGGTQFVLPERDWRGISYRALLQKHKKEKQNKAFNRLIGSANASPHDKRPSSPRDRDLFDDISSSDEDNDNTDPESSSDDDSAGYYHVGFLDDPQMVQGRNRNVMMGDKVTGPIISSTIQFVKPSVLKADLNKQFRERFDQWEPPKSQRKYIGAKIIDGVYTLIDPTKTMQEDMDDVNNIGGRGRSGSISAEHERETIRMPPSLTLSKIRSLKQQALVACVRAKIEISTLALAIIYFERLCLSCRVDKSNRRLSFAACLLLATKVNESNSVIAYNRGGTQTKSDGSELPSMISWVKPNRKSGKIFDSLIVFFTHDWSLSLKQLYAAEWIVFTALGFSLKAKPSDIAFHFKRLLRTLEWNPRSYLGSEFMYEQWQLSLAEESHQNERRKARRERRIKQNERRLLKLQRKLHMQQSKSGVDEFASRRRSSTSAVSDETRRHSVGSGTTLSSDGVSTSPRNDNLPPESAQGGDNTISPERRKTEGVAIRGLLSRLARQKQASHEKELDKMPKLERRSISASVPNLSSLDPKRKDLPTIFSRESDSRRSLTSRVDEEEGLFV